MEITVSKGNITRDFTGDYHVTLIVPKEEKNNIEPLNELLNNEKLKVAKIDNKRKKRSLNANNYAWAIITQIADVLRASKEEIYLQMLKRYGPSSVISVVKEAAEVFEKSVKYSERFGESCLNLKDFIHIKVFMGSSEFDTKQMTIFIDGIVSEAKGLKIPTMTPSEIERLKEQWGR
jgi:hypothetical protein